MNTKTYWHFIKEDRRLGYGDGLESMIFDATWEIAK